MNFLHVAFLALFIYGFEASKKGQPETVHHGHAPHEAFHAEHFHGGDHHAHKDHEAILGSKQEAEEFDNLPASESKARLRKLAAKMDTNGDGLVDKSELTAWIIHSMETMDQQEMDERFASIDKNGDGRMTWEEYEQDTFGGVDSSKLDADDKRLWSEDNEYFKAADVNGDGFLDIKEFTAFQSPEHHPHMHDSLIRNTLNEKDSNKDGFIDLKEFLGDYADRPDSEWYESEKTRFAGTYDVDKDGKLNKEEMRLWLAPDVRNTARQETDHLFEQTDANKDAMLSFDEIVDQHALFVGSEATNYGDDLLNHTEL